ncbi:glycosyltransferase family 1 protein [Microbacterium stercoris]|uniref:Glycosyltransferase family 1 protein n=1 Tax=Microbacterium stercoris TaxID=2820289 RepID=A0A939QL78_9MICO|nr:glycosyltransferase family 1 protein [Microbacterium stercoris]MBO3664983.1 glycosyltransferase family 1 protein [Microbacterium stercoris]
MTTPTPTRPSLLIVSFSPIIADARLLKQIALFRDDYAITTLGHGEKPDGVVEHLRIPDELAVWRYPRLAVVLRQYRRAYRENKAIAAATSALRGRVFDVAIANDVDAVGVALSTTVRAGIHADLHEYAPRQHEELLRFRVFVKPFIEWICRHHVAKAGSWSTVSNGLAREYARRFGFRPVVVTNAAPFVDAVPTEVHDPIRFVHSGAAQRSRFLDTIVDGVLASRAGTLDLYLTPNDPSYIDELKQRAATTGGRVRVQDPVPYARLAETLRGYDVGIHILPPVNFNNRWALPNKIFDYVQARLGVLIGPSPEMAEYVTGYGLGVVAEDFSAQALARAIDGLTPETVSAAKAKAHAHARELSSENQVTAWRSAVEALLARL